LAGELLSQSRRRKLEQMWGIPIYNFYGTTEAGNLASSCKYGNLHCSSGRYFIYEVLDRKTKKEVASGEKGILHITTLSKEAFPLLRYNVGDIVELSHEKCQCGNENPILVHHGRVSEEVENSL